MPTDYGQVDGKLHEVKLNIASKRGSKTVDVRRNKGPVAGIAVPLNTTVA